jgi:N4-gp56 family major capsid protein
VLLDGANNFRFPDGTYAGIIHPAQVYDLQANTSTGNWVDINKYTGGVENIYRGEIGRMYGVRFVVSTNVKDIPVSVSGFSAIASYSAHGSGKQALIIAPGAYHVVELDGGMAQTYVKGLGSAGTADPVNQNATVGAKVYFQCVPNTLDTRQIRLRTSVTVDA